MQEPETHQVNPVSAVPFSAEAEQGSSQEAPGAIKLRAEARESYDSISKEMMEAAQAGQTSDEIMADFAARMALEVRGRLKLAEQLNSERRAILAEQAIAPVVRAIDDHGVVETSSEAHSERHYPELVVPSHIQPESTAPPAVAA